MNYASSHKPVKLNLDKSSHALQPDESFFLLNHDVNNKIGKATPMAANYEACDLQLGAGENYNVGSYYSPLTNETYAWTYNSNSVNFIWRIQGSGECQIVYEGDCLLLSEDPKHQITQFRGYLKYDKLCSNRHGRYLIWVDGSDKAIGMVDTEASINTNFFTTPFFDICPSPCSYLQLCVPEPSSCLTGQWIPFTDADKGLSNKMTDRGLKFMYRHVYYDERASEWSDRSSLYFQDARGCFDNSEGFSRCMKFRLPIGNPLVSIIDFAFSEDGGITWFKAESIEKYKKYNSSQQYWYERDLSELVSATYSDSDCSFDYIFCNDKQRVSIDPLQVSRVVNPMPRGVQGLLPMPKESLGFYNYLKGFCPIGKNESEKITLTLNCDNVATSCDTEFVDVTFRAIVYNNFATPSGGYIFRSGGVPGAEDDLEDEAHFGVGFKGMEQMFEGEIRNYQVYIEGTNYFGVMEQYRATPNFNTSTKVGVLAGVVSGTILDTERLRLEADIANGNFYVNQVTIKVPKGMKGYARLVGHQQLTATGASQNTSTQVAGVLATNGLKSYNGTTNLNGLYNEYVKEIYFDTCYGAVDNFDAFIVVNERVNNEFGYSGYITDNNNLPVTGVRIYANGTYKRTTDYNGFYFFHDDTDTQDIDVRVETDCVSSWQTIEDFTVVGYEIQMAHADYKIESTSYAGDFYEEVDIPVKDCNDLSVAGVRVVMSGEKYKVSDVDGIAHFKVRNYETRARSVTAIVMDKGNCFTLDCSGNCNPCMPATAPTTLEPCFLNTPQTTIVLNTQIDTTNLSANRVGLKHGGRYPMGWVGKGDCGILTAVNEIGYYDIPSVQEQGNLAFCSFNFDMGSIEVPLSINEIVFVRGENLNPYNLQWVVDEIERTADGKIKLTIQSLNDYNANFNFKTNTVYKWLAGDRVEFIRNGDGQIFDTLTYGLLNYLTLSPFNDEVLSGVTDDVDYFNQLLINDDSKLDGLVKGAIIELQTPSIATTEITYKEFCARVPVENGVPLIQNGNFTTFDTYLVSRQIDTFPAQFFESKTPSDFWGGTNLDDTGKVHFVNKYENERRFGRNITVNSPTQFNYFGDFEKQFDSIQHGDLIAIFLKDEKIGLALSQFDNSLFRVNDDLLRLGSDNLVRAVPVDNLISNTEPKLRGEFGVSYADIGSILSGDGFCTYISSPNDDYIIHDYSSAKKAGHSINERGMIITQCSSYFKKRIRQKENFNKTSNDFLNHYRYSTGINKNTGVVYLTIKTLRQPGINNEKGVYLAQNETIMYNPINDNYLGFCSFTPENYSQLDLNTDSGCAFLSFQNSIPYIHMSVPDRWNEFYEVAVDWMVGITVNAENNVIVPLAIELQSSTKFFVTKVTTDKPSFLSEIPPIKFKFSNYKWNGAFLNDINSIGGLHNGTNARGYYIQALFIRDNTINDEYNSINNAKRTIYSELDEILVKFMTSQQSSFTLNV